MSKFETAYWSFRVWAIMTFRDPGILNRPVFSTFALLPGRPTGTLVWGWGGGGKTMIGTRVGVSKGYCCIENMTHFKLEIYR